MRGDGVQRRSPPSMRSRTKKQFSSSWKAYLKLTTNGWSICLEGTMSDGSEAQGRRIAHLFEKPALLDDVRDGLHLDAFRLVDVLERVEVACLFVLDDADLERQRIVSMREGGRPENRTDLSEGALADAAEEDKVEEVDVAVKVDGLGRRRSGAGRRR
jgi:hypothetical protein